LDSVISNARRLLRRNPRLAALLRCSAALAMGAVLLSACGARVGPYLGAEGSTTPLATSTTATTAATSSTSTTVASQGTNSGGGSAAPAGSSESAVASAAQAAASTSNPLGFNFNPSSETGDCPGNAGNTASAPGVTPSQITFGNVSGETGPLTGSFTQGGQGVQALFSAVNAAGGICGRTLALDEEDDQQNASNNAADVQDLIPKVLAFAGSVSDADNGGVPFMEQAGVPDFGFAINCNRSESSTYWSPAGGSCDYQGGRYYISNAEYRLARQYGYLPAKMAFLSYNIGISAQAAEEFAYVYQSMGGDVCYTDYSISPATASLESDVEQMQADGCQGVQSTMDVTGEAKLLDALQQQSLNLPFVVTTFDGYTPDQISDAGQSAAQGLIVGLPFIPLNEPNPMVQMYLSQLQTYEPGAEPSGFGFLSWEAAQMMVYALIAAGHNPTRQNLTTVMDGISNWDGGGALGPYTPSGRGVYVCNVDVEVKGDAFVRKEPPTGIYCGGQLVAASP
jgi:branched-chain amino acid transport system substrate-binding protein